MEDFISLWELVDVKPQRGKYTWTNKHIGIGNKTAMLERFLVQSTFLESDFVSYYRIIPWVVLDHKTVTLLLKEVPDYGPIPFLFNPIWLHDKTMTNIITCTWCKWVVGSLVHIWEQKLKDTNKFLKEWEKTHFTPPKIEVQTCKEKLESIKNRIELEQVTQGMVNEEREAFQRYEKSLHKKEMIWRLKSRIL